jgi:YggT family protein
MEMLRRITDPLIRPVRRVIPLIGGVDLSPLVVLIGLQLLKMLLLRPLLVLA